MVKPGTGRNDSAMTGDHRVRPSKKKGDFNGKTEAMADTGQNAFRAVTDTRNKRSVWNVQTFSYPEAHFATYPPDLIKPCIMAGTKPGDVVLDPFGGSGTTGQVAIELGRRAILCELNEDYAQIIHQRTNVTMGLAL
jgi:DNA modification methylase